MAKKQFDNVVSNITRPNKERVVSMSELLDDEKISSVNTSAQIEATEARKEMIRQEKSNEVASFTHNTSNHRQVIVQQQKEQRNNMVIRDGFSMPEHDYQLIEVLIRKAGLLGHNVNKSEILRAGLQTLNRLSDDEFFQVIQGVTQLKPGRKVE